MRSQIVHSDPGHSRMILLILAESSRRRRHIRERRETRDEEKWQAKRWWCGKTWSFCSLLTPLPLSFAQCIHTGPLLLCSWMSIQFHDLTLCSVYAAPSRIRKDSVSERERDEVRRWCLTGKKAHLSSLLLLILSDGTMSSSLTPTTAKKRGTASFFLHTCTTSREKRTAEWKNKHKDINCKKSRREISFFPLAINIHSNSHSANDMVSMANTCITSLWYPPGTTSSGNDGVSSDLRHPFQQEGRIEVQDKKQQKNIQRNMSIHHDANGVQRIGLTVRRVRSVEESVEK